MYDKSPGSVTLLIKELKVGDEQAARQLWERYFNSIRDLARRRISDEYRLRVCDEEDVALSVFNTLCSGARDGKFDQLLNRDDLWGLLVILAGHKIINQKRWETRVKRGGTDSSRDYGSDHDIEDDQPDPAMLVQFSDERKYMLDLLRTDDLREIAVGRLEGYTARELAARIGVTERTIQRKIKLIYERWKKELLDRAELA